MKIGETFKFKNTLWSPKNHCLVPSKPLFCPLKFQINGPPKMIVLSLQILSMGTKHSFVPPKIIVWSPQNPYLVP